MRQILSFLLNLIFNILSDIPILDGQKCPKYGTTNIPTQQADPQYTYPKAVLFILCSKFFESFAANGVRSKK